MHKGIQIAGFTYDTIKEQKILPFPKEKLALSAQYITTHY